MTEGRDPTIHTESNSSNGVDTVESNEVDPAERSLVDERDQEQENGQNENIE